MCTPTHLYITLAITVATFAWLNKPSKLGELSVCEISMGCLAEDVVREQMAKLLDADLSMDIRKSPPKCTDSEAQRVP